MPDSAGEHARSLAARRRVPSAAGGTSAPRSLLLMTTEHPSPLDGTAGGFQGPLQTLTATPKIQGWT